MWCTSPRGFKIGPRAVEYHREAAHRISGVRARPIFMIPLFGTLLALVCALATNVGFLYKHRGACAAPAVDIRRPLWSARKLFASRLFALGILFGVSDVAIKAISGLIGTSGPAGLLTPWTLVMVAASVAAFYASAKGLQDGDAVPVIAVTGTAANVAGIVGGIIVFGDPLSGNPLWLSLQCLAFVLVLFAAWLMPAPVRAAPST